jgi:ATP-dependent Zn protease
MVETFREATAYHEAGHIVAAYDIGIEVGSSTIVACKATQSLGHTDLRPLLESCQEYRDAIRAWAQKSGSWTQGQEKARAELMDQAMMLMAGPVAQTLLTGACLYEVWKRDADKTVVRCIESDSQDAGALLEEASERAKRLLVQKWFLVEAVADALLKHETLSSAQVEKIVQEGKPGA